MIKQMRTFLIFAIIFGIFLFAVCETQITATTGIIDRDRLISFRLKNASIGVLSVFGHKTYIDADAARSVGEAFTSVKRVCFAFLPKFLVMGLGESADGYLAVFDNLKSLFSEERTCAEPPNAGNF